MEQVRAGRTNGACTQILPEGRAKSRVVTDVQRKAPLIS